MTLLNNATPDEGDSGEGLADESRRAQSRTRIFGRRRLDLRRSMKRVLTPSPAVPSPFDEAAPLSPFLVRRLAGRKGYIVDTIMQGKGGRRFVRLSDGISGEA